MYHAAEPTNIDQGIFNTCNVTTMQEGLFASRPSVMADMLAQASLTGTYRSPHDGRVTRLDRNSMMPVPGSEHPNADQGERSYATQLLNHVMVNEISQRRIPPQFYSQITRTGDRNDNGERLTTGGFTGNEVLFNGRVARQPVITIADMGAAMQRYGRPDSVFYNSTATGWEHPSVVTFRNVEEMTRRITERIASGAPVIMYIRDVSGLPRGQGGPDTPHVISITGIRPDGVVSFSNQWGRHGDGSMRIEDLFRISRGRT